MTDKKLTYTKVVLGSEAGELVRFSHLHVDKPRLNTQSKKMEYSVAILIPKTAKKTIAAVKAAIDVQEKQFFPTGKKGPQFWYPLRDGDNDTKQNGDPLGAECKGHYVLSAKSEEPVGVVGTTKGADGKLKSLLVDDKGVALSSADIFKAIKSGDFGRVSVNIKGYVKGSGGVAAYLNNVQKVQDGDSLGGGGIDAADEFADYGEEDVLG